MNLTESSNCQSTHCESKKIAVQILRPAVKTHQAEDGVRLNVALPGVPKDQLKLSVRDSLLSLEATRDQSGTGVRYELSMQLSSRLDGNAIQANLEDGVLTAFVPLKEESKPRLIPIA